MSNIAIYFFFIPTILYIPNGTTGVLYWQDGGRRVGGGRGWCHLQTLKNPGVFFSKYLAMISDPILSCLAKFCKLCHHDEIYDAIDDVIYAVLHGIMQLSCCDYHDAVSYVLQAYLEVGCNKVVVICTYAIRTPVLIQHVCNNN